MLRHQRKGCPLQNTVDSEHFDRGFSNVLTDESHLAQEETVDELQLCNIDRNIDQTTEESIIKEDSVVSSGILMN
jgi:hypothetical protein